MKTQILREVNRMNQFIVENQGINTFLVYHFKPEDQIDTFSYGMISNNKIPGIIPTILTQINDDKCFKFNISSRISLDQFFNGIVNKASFLSIFSSITNAILASDEYMLDPTCFLLDTKNIYVNVGTREAEIICFPIIVNESQVELVQFFKNIVFQTQFDQTENADYVAKIISFLNSSNNFSLLDFKKLLDSLMAGGNGAVQGNVERQEPAQQPQPQVQPQMKPQMQSPLQPQVQPQTSQMPQMPQMQTRTDAQTAIPSQPKRPEPMPQMTSMGDNQPKPSIPSPKSGPIPPKMEMPGSSPMPIPGGGQMPGAVSDTHKGEKKKSLFGNIFGGGKSTKKEHAPKPNKKDAKGAKGAKGAKNSGIQMPGQQNGPSIPAAPTMPDASNGMQIPNPVPIVPTQAQPKPIQSMQPIPQQQPMPSPTPMRPQMEPMMSQGMPQMMYNVSSETTVLSAAPAGETTVLSADGAAGQTNSLTAYIVRQMTNEKVMLRKPVFKLGKEQSFVDYCIMNNPTISRSHANIIRKGNDYYIVDMNSKNHTYVNGMMILSGQEVKLEHGDKIALSNENFEFYLQ